MRNSVESLQFIVYSWKCEILFGGKGCGKRQSCADMRFCFPDCLASKLEAAFQIIRLRLMNLWGGESIHQNLMSWLRRHAVFVFPTALQASLRQSGKQKPAQFGRVLMNWSGRQDSNLRPSGPKPDALPACATSRGATPVGLEPTTYCLEGSCSIQLSYGVNGAAKIRI